MLLLLALAVGCSTAPAPKVREERARRERQQEDEDDYAVRINRTLIYPVQWGRAEDLAETLQPLLEASYGPGVRVIPHVATNHLLIYLPPREVLDSPGGGRMPATGGTRSSRRAPSRAAPSSGSASRGF
jgi:hypothetical protein